MLDALAQDARYALRQLRKSAGFAAITILTLSLGIGATIAIFGFVDAALIRPLPYPELSRLMAVFKTTQLGGNQSGYSFPDYIDMVRANRVFATVAAFDDQGGFVLTDANGPQMVSGFGVTNDFFRILGVAPVLGKDFDAAPVSEDLLATPANVVLSYSAWQTRFHGDAGVIGKSVTLNGEPYTVIGVLPRDFEFAPAGAADFWTTLHPFAGDACHLSRGCMVMRAVARLKPGVTIEQARADVTAIAARESAEHPDPDRNRGGNIAPIREWILGEIGPILLALLGAVGLLLLITYFNVAGLLLVRSESRRHEFAVRGVLGAGRGRLVQQFVIEGCVMVAASGALGIFGGALARELLLKLIPSDTLDTMPYLRAGWSWHVAAFAATLIAIAWSVFVIAPVIRLPFASLRAGLSEGGRGSAETSWRNLGAKLVVLELATTMVLLAGAGFLGKSLYELLHVPMGFDPSHVATFQLFATDAKYSDDQQSLALFREVVSALKNVPGVISVGTARSLPVTGVPSTQIGFADRPNLGESNEVGHQVISAEYLSVLQARLLRGRTFNERDTPNSPSVALINESLARRYFANEDPLGKRIYYHQHGSAPASSGPNFPIEIAGLIADVKEYALDEPERPVVYTPAEQGLGTSFYVAARTSQDAASVLPSMVAAVHRIDAGIMISDAATMPEIISQSWAAYLHRVLAWLAGGFAALALLLSTVGVYGVIAYSVSRRTREIGVRMALGASRGSVYQLIMREAGRLAAVGLAIGICCSVAAGVFTNKLLFGVRSWDATILGAVAAVLIASAGLASFLPARRAARINPIEALRSE